MAGAVVVAGLFLLSFLAPFITPCDPNTIDAYHVLLPPSTSHWMGTDELGRDVFTRIIYGARISLKVGFVAVGIGFSAVLIWKNDPKTKEVVGNFLIKVALY